MQLAGGAEPRLAQPAEQALVDAAVAFADVDEVVVVAMTGRRGGPALIAQRCGGAPARCTAAAEIGFDDRAGLAAAAADRHDRRPRLRPLIVSAQRQNVAP